MKITDNLLHNQSYVFWSREKGYTFSVFLHKSLLFKLTEILELISLFSYIIIGWIILWLIIYLFLTQWDLWTGLYVITLSATLYLSLCIFIVRQISEKRDWKKTYLRIGKRFSMEAFLKSIGVLDYRKSWVSTIRAILNFFLLYIFGMWVIFSFFVKIKADHDWLFALFLPLLIVLMWLCIVKFLWKYLHKISIIKVILSLLLSPLILILCLYLYVYFRIRWVPEFIFIKKIIHWDKKNIWAIAAFEFFDDWGVEIRNRDIQNDDISLEKNNYANTRI